MIKKKHIYVEELKMLCIIAFKFIGRRKVSLHFESSNQLSASYICIKRHPLYIYYTFSLYVVSSWIYSMYKAVELTVYIVLLSTVVDFYQ